MWVLGPVIDNVTEPKFRKLAPAPGEPASQEFLLAQKRHLPLEVIATALFFAIITLWVLG